MQRFKITPELIDVIRQCPYSLQELSKQTGFEVKNIVNKNVSIRQDHLQALSRVVQGLPSLKQYTFDYSKNLGAYATSAPVPPLKESPELAEFIGIMLGDGNIYKNRVRIALNKQDFSYIDHVWDLAKDVSSLNFKKDFLITKNNAYLYVYNKSLIKELLGFGLQRGDKMKNKICIPEWIWGSEEYSKGVFVD